MEFANPHDVSIEEINAVIDVFAHATEYPEKADYDGENQKESLFIEFVDQTV
jgi:hypothetical protein